MIIFNNLDLLDKCPKMNNTDWHNSISGLNGLLVSPTFCTPLKEIPKWKITRSKNILPKHQNLVSEGIYFAYSQEFVILWSCQKFLDRQLKLEIIDSNNITIIKALYLNCGIWSWITSLHSNNFLCWVTYLCMIHNPR